MWSERRLETDGLELVWDEQGSGPAVIFLSGGPGDSGGYLQPLAEPLTDEYRCVVPDLRGTGRSQARPGTELTIAALTADLERVRQALGVEQVRLVGHSFGANLALLYAARSPKSVAGAALVGLGPLDASAAEQARTNLAARLNREQRSTFAAVRRRRHQAAAAGDEAAFREAFLAQVELMLPVLVLDPGAGRRLVEARRNRFDHWPAVHTAVTADLAGIDQWEALARTRAPLLVLYGDRDFEPIDQASAIAQSRGTTDVRIVPGAAHLPWLDRASEVTFVLRAFLGARPAAEEDQR